MTTESVSEERERLRIRAAAGQGKVRLDVFLSRQIENATRSKVQQAIQAGAVLVNGRKAKSSYLVQPEDLIEVTLPRPPRTDAQPENIPLNIVYEDDVLIVVNKPAGMVVHPAYGNYTGTLVNALLYHYNQLSHAGDALRPGIVHRLDKETSGLLVVAKSDAAHAFLARQFAKRSIEREYWALVWGKFRSVKGTIEANLARSKKDRTKVAVSKEGKHAVTEYEVQKQFGFLSLVKLHLHTGRTHQIRVHLGHIGHPVFGDPTYGGRSNTWGGLEGKKAQHAANLLKLISRQALHAKTIGFVHPATKEKVRFESDLPEDFRAVLAKLSTQPAGST
ncbi:MAG: RluA family pseudouridine synthase [Ignavibacteriales bacterium]|nr:RluA family pseudouridine synthase [Ignavibacteriales bacterium]